MPLKYKPQIKQKIPEVVEKILGIKTDSIERLHGGEVNYSFKVEAADKCCLVKVFRYQDWPDIKTLRFVRKKLDRIDIAYPKILYYDSSRKHFQYGFMILEWIPGIPGDKAINKNLVEKNNLFKIIAQTLKKVHSLEMPGFMQSSTADKQKQTFDQFINNSYSLPRLNKLQEKGLVSKSLIEKNTDKLNQLVKTIDFQVSPVLVHGDATPHNIIYQKKDNNIVLIDWEDAKASSWVFDLAYITYHWGKTFRNLIISEHGLFNLQRDQVIRLETIFHLQLGLKLLPYYAFDTKNVQAFHKTLDKLESFN
jgi:thiamine kinase-like enzyme